jgi:hypothetical protein
MTNDDLRKLWPDGKSVISTLASDGKPIVLAFSCGKDSIAAFVKLRDANIDVRPVYKVLVPGLEFVAASIAYYERWFGLPILQVPHDSLYRWLANLTFQVPQNCAIIEQAGLAKLSREEIQAQAVRLAGLPSSTWTAVGTRACDNLNRRMSFARFGPWREESRTCYPVWDASKDDVIATIRAAGVKLPAEYRIFGRSFDGLDFRFLYGIKKHFPRDFARILEWFPHADLEIYRYECFQRHHATA